MYKRLEFPESTIDSVKIVIHALMVLGLIILSVLAMRGITYIRNSGDPNVDYLSSFLVLCFIWLAISEWLSSKNKDTSGFSAVLTTVGFMAIQVLSVCYVTSESGVYLFLNSASGAAEQAWNIFREVIYSLGHPFLMSVLMLISFVLCYPLFSIRALIWIVAGFIMSSFNVSNIAYLIALEIVIVISGVILEDERFDDFKDNTDYDEFSWQQLNPLNADIGTWIMFVLIVALVIISFYVGKVTSWTEYLKCVFENDYIEMVQITGDINNAILIVSVLISFAISTLVSGLVDDAVHKVLKPNIITKVSIILIDVLVNVWVLSSVTRLIMKVYTGEALQEYDQMLDNMPALLEYDIIPQWLYVLVNVAVVLTIIILSIFGFAALWGLIGKMLIEGIIFLYICYFINGLFELDYSTFSAFEAFLLLYAFNFVTSTIAENASKWSLFKKFWPI